MVRPQELREPHCHCPFRSNEFRVCPSFGLGVARQFLRKQEHPSLFTATHPFESLNRKNSIHIIYIRLHPSIHPRLDHDKAPRLVPEDGAAAPCLNLMTTCDSALCTNKLSTLGSFRMSVIPPWSELLLFTTPTSY